MFREMRRKKQEVSKECCIKILEQEKRAVVSFKTEDYPYAIPMNYLYKDNKIYLHCGFSGQKIDAMMHDNRVCFTTWDKGYKKEGDWAYYVTSVVIYGRIHFIKDDIILKALGMKYFPSEDELNIIIEKHYKNVQLLCIEIEHMTGKLVHEK